MLVEFSVKNFLSFKEKVTLSMEKGKGNDMPENSCFCADMDLLKMCSIYGANASGKSNLLKAFTSAILMVRNSNLMPLDGKWSFIKPFVFDEEKRNQPSEFEFIFIINDVKYKYCYSADMNKIYNESLDAYFSQKSTNIFVRTNTNEYVFNSDKSILESLTSKNTDNKLFLSTATTWNYEKTKDVFLWFSKCIDVYDSFDNIMDSDLISYSNNDNNLKEFALKLLNEADMNIKSINVNYDEKDMDSTMMNMFIPSFARINQNNQVKNVEIVLEHEIKDSNLARIYELDFEDESSGTKTLLAMAPFLKRAFESKKIIIADELERSLHPLLIEYIIKLFNNDSVNIAGSQLIFTTHAINLLNLNLLRRDQIYFTEKNSDNGVTDLFPLDSFSIRKEENIQKGYISGRYGAIPFIKDNNAWHEYL